MALPPEYNFEDTAGDDVVLSFVYEEIEGVPHTGLAGATARMQIRSRSTDVVALAEASVSINVPTAEFTCTIDAVTSQAILPTNKPNGTFLYDIEVTFANGDKKTILTGELTLIQGVTR